MIPKKILELLNKQITNEEYSANMYLSMGGWCHNKGFEGAGNFLIQHAEEERLHMKKLFHFVLEKGEMAVMGAMAEPPSQFDSIRSLFEKVLEHEQFITRSINSIAESAMAEKEFSIFNFMQWFIAEQHEEELLIQTILDKINLIGMDGQGKYLIDQEIAKIAANPPQSEIKPQIQGA